VGGGAHSGPTQKPAGLLNVLTTAGTALKKHAVRQEKFTAGKKNRRLVTLGMCPLRRGMARGRHVTAVGRKKRSVVTKIREKKKRDTTTALRRRERTFSLFGEGEMWPRGIAGVFRKERGREKEKNVRMGVGRDLEAELERDYFGAKQGGGFVIERQIRAFGKKVVISGGAKTLGAQNLPPAKVGEREHRVETRHAPGRKDHTTSL